VVERGESSQTVDLTQFGATQHGMHVCSVTSPGAAMCCIAPCHHCVGRKGLLFWYSVVHRCATLTHHRAAVVFLVGMCTVHATGADSTGAVCRASWVGFMNGFCEGGGGPVKPCVGCLFLLLSHITHAESEAGVDLGKKEEVGPLVLQSTNGLLCL
jgi:hypothetical protein